MFESLDQKKNEWLALQPLKPQDEQRLWKKLRLEWNYHSNHIEGNTLTYGETELLLIHDQASGDHALRNYVEMKGHDAAIEHLRKLAKEERLIGESDVRDLNQILLKEPFTKEAINPDGQPTQIEIIPGQYKQQPNNVRTADGGIFEFAAPADVPAKMAELVEWLRNALGCDVLSIHPIQTASKLHHEFSLIHPFGDGNGRIARLLVNYVLMRSNYVPLIVPTEQKDTYLAALRKADSGDLDALTSYLARCAETALDRCIRAAKGESLEEPGDLEKEIEVFKRQQEPESRKVEPKSPEALRNLYESSLKHLFAEFVESLGALNELFHEVVIEPKGPTTIGDQSWDQAICEAFTSPNSCVGNLVLSYRLKGFRGAPAPFDVECFILINSQEFHYQIAVNGVSPETRLYTQPITEVDRREIIKQGLQSTFAEIKRLSGQD